jgi:predicted ABC-type ATPase
MIVIAGPPGSGKSSRFPLSSFGVDSFNADERAAELNFGSFRKISPEIRSRVNQEFERWVLGHIGAQQDFALETTLRSTITFEQAKLARERGFWTTMDYVSSGGVDESVRRIMERSYRGGHSASERLIAQIYERSITNLLAALEFPESGFEVVKIYDNSVFGSQVRQILTLRQGRLQLAAHNLPDWMKAVLKGSKFDPK